METKENKTKVIKSSKACYWASNSASAFEQVDRKDSKGSITGNSIKCLSLGGKDWAKISSASTIKKELREEVSGKRKVKVEVKGKGKNKVKESRVYLNFRSKEYKRNEKIASKTSICFWYCSFKTCWTKSSSKACLIKSPKNWNYPTKSWCTNKIILISRRAKRSSKNLNKIARHKTQRNNLRYQKIRSETASWSNILKL